MECLTITSKPHLTRSGVLSGLEPQHRVANRSKQICFNAKKSAISEAKSISFSCLQLDGGVEWLSITEGSKDQSLHFLA